MRKKLFGTMSLAVVGALAVGSVALAESISGSGATFPQQFQASATAAFNAATGHNASYANPGGGSSKGVTDFAGVSPTLVVLTLRSRRPFESILTGFMFLTLAARSQSPIASTSLAAQRSP